jgi:hypothetical protein
MRDMIDPKTVVDGTGMCDYMPLKLKADVTRGGSRSIQAKLVQWRRSDGSIPNSLPNGSYLLILFNIPSR